ncbi:hypothetical protein [Desulfobacter hydrogenophilus]|nr:hypothetical protein [Desulfobacter hydrogenophilus]NDY71435.1 hypothetical protein [Desulfobacter hydrogenophilus]
MEKVTQLKEEGVSLTDEIAIAAAKRAKKKEAFSKLKTEKKKPEAKL